MAETFVANHEEVESIWRGSVLGGIDLLVCLVRADAQNFNERSSAVRRLGYRRLSHFRKVRLAASIFGGTGMANFRATVCPSST